MKYYVIIFLALLVFSHPSKSADFMTSDEYWKGKTLYMSGDHKGAFSAWIKSAKSGIPEAQGLIAGLYHAGHGVEKDYDKAYKWYEISAKKGFSPSQLGLGNMIADGLGIKKDYIKAHMWFNLSAANGNERGQYNLKKIEQRMKMSEIKEAEKLANLWLKKYPQ